ncbi:hypothetical protein D9M68_756630 [compost metagenome]
MSLEEIDTKLLFQIAYLATEGRLGDVQSVSSFAEATEFGHMNQCLELNDIHQ